MKHFTIVSSLIKNRYPCTQSSAAFSKCATYFTGNKGPRDSDTDEETSVVGKKALKRSQQALDKLNLLLKQMVNEDTITTQTQKLNLAKPKNKRLLRKEPGEQEVKVQTTDQQMVQVVKDVASSLGDDTKKTESDLLMKLLSTSAEATKSASNLSEIVKGMEIDRSVNSPEKHSRAQEVRQILQRMTPTARKASSETRVQQRPPRRQITETPINIEKIDLFGGEKLGIFDKIETPKEENENKTWNKLYAEELKLAVTHPPSNYFRHMILWTEQGKIWKFPIDNEQGWKEEQNICFSEHIFLEEHLHSWCPSKGPIRHFMELVCVGLSKNPYLSVEAKKEHIHWYRDYFADKKKLLREVGAISETTKDRSM